MRKYDMMERAQDTDMLDCMLYNYIVSGKIKCVDGVLIGKTYDVKNAIKSPFGMAGKWNKAVKGWEVSKENFEREFANLAERWAD